MRCLRRPADIALAVLATLSLTSSLAAPVWAQGVDPLTAEVELDDAERFAALFNATDDAPTPAQLQEHYLDKGGRALEIFTPYRIIDAENLAANIAYDPAYYREAIERCLPLVKPTESDLRAIYLGLRGLFPEKPLPRIAVIFGARNSGGTAGAGMQVLGIEVQCEISKDAATFRATMRHFYAHETVHTWQMLETVKQGPDPLLAQVIAEGTADYISSLVTGELPVAERDEWARENAAMVWREFAADLAITRDPTMPDERRNAAFRRWVANAGSPPEGWPSELGYWVGMKIAEGYVANSPDPHTALRELMIFDDAGAILEGSGILLP